MSVSLIAQKRVQRELLPTMANWRGVWNTNASYAYGDIVQGGDNNGYVANVPNSGEDPVSGSAPSPWSSLASAGASGGMNFAGNPWNGAIAYGSEDVVIGANGASYVATGASTGINPVNDVSGAVPWNGTVWARLSGANVLSQWNGSALYGVGDCVVATLPNGQLATFQAGLPNSNSAPAIGNANWTPLADEPGSSMSYIGGWLSNVSYDRQDVVDLSGYAFVSKVNANSNVVPSFSGVNANWVPLSGSNSLPQIHTKTSTGTQSSNFCAPAGITAGTWSNLFTIPNTAQNGETGTLVLNSSFGIGGSNQGTWAVQVSDVSGAVPSANAFYSLSATGSNAYGGLTPLSGTMTYSFKTAPNPLFVNVLFGNSNGGATFTPGSTATGFSYTNTITSAQFITDP